MLSKRKAAEMIVKNDGCFDLSELDCDKTCPFVRGCKGSYRSFNIAEQWLIDNPYKEVTMGKQENIWETFLDWLDEKGCKDEYFRYITNDANKKEKRAFVPCNFVLDSFFWSASDSGYSFWDKINGEWIEKLKELGFPKGQTEENDCVKDEPTTAKFHAIYESHEKMLMEKNRRYGNSALEPVKVFAKHLEDIDSILIRLDDKISRIRNGEEIRKNDVSDIMGYLVLLCKANGWEDFSD